MHVIVDMHQDLWGEQCGGNGAPAWAASDIEASARGDGPWWITGVSPCVVESQNAFYKEGNYQKEFIESWRAVAERFHDHPAVLGYDLFNEPNEIEAIVDYLVNTNTSKELRLFLLNGPNQALSLFQSEWVFKEIIKVLAPVALSFEGLELPGESVNKIADVVVSRSDWGHLNALREFEGGVLTDLYQRVISAIREVDDESYIFVEPMSVSGGDGGEVFLGELSDPRGEGKRRRLGYIPHLYPRNIDRTEVYQDSDFEALSRWRENHRDYAARENLVLLTGEFGLSSKAAGARRFLNDAILMMERDQIGWLYWDSKPGSASWGPFLNKELEESRNAAMLKNIYPSAVAGAIDYYNFDRRRNTFTLIYSANEATGTTDISIPKEFIAGEWVIQSSDPEETWGYEYDEERSIVRVTHDPASSMHKIVVRPAHTQALAYRELKNGLGGKCLSYEGVRPRDDADIVLKECGSHHSWQRWEFDEDGGSLRLLQDPDYCLSHGVAGEAKERGRVSLKKCNLSPNLSWEFDDGMLRNLHDTDIVLNASRDEEGALVNQMPDTGNRNQMWQWGRY